jgi:muramoyltetrapeptide carboxypeptidase
MVGFSDVTALHVEISRLGMASMHAHHVAGLGRADAHAREQWLEALEQPHIPRVFRGLRVLHSGSARGPLMGGNLSLLFTCAAAGRLRLPARCVLVIEEVSESSYRIDRMLSALRVSGALQDVSGVVVGELTDCSAGRYSVSAEAVFQERLADLAIPVVIGLPVGHGTVNHPLPLGFEATLDADAGTLEIRQPA